MNSMQFGRNSVGLSIPKLHLEHNH